MSTLLERIIDMGDHLGLGEETQWAVNGINSFSERIKAFASRYDVALDIDASDVTSAVTDFLFKDAIEWASGIKDAFQAAAADGTVDGQDLKNIIKSVLPEEEPAATPPTPGT